MLNEHEIQIVLLKEFLNMIFNFHNKFYGDWFTDFQNDCQKLAIQNIQIQFIDEKLLSMILLLPFCLCPFFIEPVIRSKSCKTILSNTT